MNKKTFLDLKDGDKVYLLDFAVNGIPNLIVGEISITHCKSTSKLIVCGTYKFTVKNKKTYHATERVAVSPNKEEIFKRYDSFLKGMINQYKKQIEECQNHISEYENALTNVTVIMD
jgi:hypothetical protein